MAVSVFGSRKLSYTTWETRHRSSDCWTIPRLQALLFCIHVF